MGNGVDQALGAFRRLLADASAGGQAKVDALVALSQRTVWVATWTPDSDGFRTLTNSHGKSALPIFTDRGQLDEAAQRFGWLAADGQASGREVGAREALRHAVAHNVEYVVIDIVSMHSLELDREEVEPIVSPEARRESQGPFAAVGRLSSTMMKAVKPTPTPGSLSGLPGFEQNRPPARISTPPPRPAVGAEGNFGAGSAVSLSSLASEPSDDLLDALSTVLRGYPEVEWAALASVARGPTQPIPTVGLRVNTSYRERVQEIITELRKAADVASATVDVMLLDDPQVMRDARRLGVAFYPWRKR
ncbi:MAG: SseB family protein [Myxococcota bacterium]